MAKQISAKLLDQLENQYRRQIRYRAEETSRDHETIIGNINLKRQNQLAKAVRDAIETIPELRGINVGSTVKTNYNGYTIIELSLKLDEIDDPELKDALKKKREHCEMFRDKYAEIDEWRINCIKSGEVLPIDIPEIPKQEPSYRCE